jgi:protein ECT2
MDKRAQEIEKARTELFGAKRQCELLKSLLSDATDENEILFESFNEELDMMFNDAQLPEEEAWEAMVNDLRKTKETRNQLKKENS